MSFSKKPHDKTQRELRKKLAAVIEQTKPPPKLVGGLQFQIIFVKTW